MSFLRQSEVEENMWQEVTSTNLDRRIKLPFCSMTKAGVRLNILSFFQATNLNKLACFDIQKVLGGYT